MRGLYLATGILALILGTLLSIVGSLLLSSAISELVLVFQPRHHYSGGIIAIATVLTLFLHVQVVAAGAMSIISVTMFFTLGGHEPNPRMKMRLIALVVLSAVSALFILIGVFTYLQVLWFIPFTVLSVVLLVLSITSLCLNMGSKEA